MSEPLGWTKRDDGEWTYYEGPPMRRVYLFSEAERKTFLQANVHRRHSMLARKKASGRFIHINHKGERE